MWEWHSKNRRPRKQDSLRNTLWMSGEDRLCCLETFSLAKTAATKSEFNISSEGKWKNRLWRIAQRPPHELPKSLLPKRSINHEIDSRHGFVPWSFQLQIPLRTPDLYWTYYRCRLLPGWSEVSLGLANLCLECLSFFFWESQVEVYACMLLEKIEQNYSQKQSMFTKAGQSFSTLSRDLTLSCASCSPKIALEQTTSEHKSCHILKWILHKLALWIFVIT